jgi:hypothetical protein
MSQKKNNWEVIVEEDPETGELILPLPEDFLQKAGLKEGDEIEWIDNKDGTFTITKASNSNS